MEVPLRYFLDLLRFEFAVRSSSPGLAEHFVSTILIYNAYLILGL